MEKDILQRIAEECGDYSKRQKAIARYICENSEIVAFMTAQMLSEAAGVSESSVVRFARQLGFDGYIELRRALQQLIKDRIATREEAAEMASREWGQLVAAGGVGVQSAAAPQGGGRAGAHAPICGHHAGGQGTGRCGCAYNGASLRSGKERRKPIGGKSCGAGCSARGVSYI